MDSNRLILAHDLGTTGNKATLFDADGALLGSAFAGYATNYPQPNWAEQNPSDWWLAVCDTTQQLLVESGADPRSIGAVGFSGQMMGCLPVDAAGTPLRSCIIWADQRAQEQAMRMAELCGADEIYAVSGHRVSAAYTAAKILWVRDHQPAIYDAAAAFLQPKDFVVQQLTGEFATDYSDASGTLLFDLTQRDWHRPFLSSLDLPAENLPTLYPSTAIVGVVTREAANATGLAVGTPVVIGGGDGACAGAGAGVVEPGGAYCSIGSSAWVSVAGEMPILDPQQRIMTFHHVHPERYAPMGVMQAAGGARQWVWDLLAMPSAELDAVIAQTRPGADGLLFLPYLLGERSPYWNPMARGAFVGLNMAHTPVEIGRATLEGVALHLRLILDILREQAYDIDAMRLIGGGSRSPVWRQILADCFDMSIQTLDLQAGATSWGAAVTAGVGVGLWDWTIADERVQIAETTEPQANRVPLYNELVAILSDAYRALEPIFDRLADIESKSGDQHDRPTATLA